MADLNEMASVLKYILENLEEHEWKEFVHEIENNKDNDEEEDDDEV